MFQTKLELEKQLPFGKDPQSITFTIKTLADHDQYLRARAPPTLNITLRIILKIKLKLVLYETILFATNNLNLWQSPYHFYYNIG